MSPIKCNVKPLATKVILFSIIVVTEAVKVGVCCWANERGGSHQLALGGWTSKSGQNLAV